MLNRLRRDNEAGRLSTTAGEMTMAQFLEYWLTELLPGTVKASTEARYADMTRWLIVSGGCRRR